MNEETIIEANSRRIRRCLERSNPMLAEIKGLNEECGVFGIWGHQDAAQITYYGLHSSAAPWARRYRNCRYRRRKA